MDILFWIVIIVAAALVALVIVSRSAARSRIDPTQVTIDPAVAAKVRGLYASNEKVKAIKVLREATGLGLADAVRIADKLGAGGKAAGSGSRPPAERVAGADVIGVGVISGADQVEIRALLAQDRKIDAIKLVRQLTGMGLKEAKDYVESL